MPANVAEAARPGPLLLLAEDNAENIALMLDYLVSKGYRLAVARNGIEAVEQACRLVPDLILMDIQMPDLDGLEAIRRIRRDERLATTPIIALTALAMNGDRERCLAAGATDYLSKPVILRNLAELIASHLALRS
jgi:CheY-like chemotaxis protein